jgi:hypothetical protein
MQCRSLWPCQYGAHPQRVRPVRRPASAAPPTHRRRAAPTSPCAARAPAAPAVVPISPPPQPLSSTLGCVPNEAAAWQVGCRRHASSRSETLALVNRTKRLLFDRPPIVRPPSPTRAGRRCCARRSAPTALPWGSAWWAYTSGAACRRASSCQACPTSTPSRSRSRRRAPARPRGARGPGLQAAAGRERQRQGRLREQQEEEGRQGSAVQMRRGAGLQRGALCWQRSHRRWRGSVRAWNL